MILTGEDQATVSLNKGKGKGDRRFIGKHRKAKRAILGKESPEEEKKRTYVHCNGYRRGSEMGWSLDIIPIGVG